LIEILTPKLNIELNVEVSNAAIADLTSITMQDWQDWFSIWLNLLTTKVKLTDPDYEISLVLTGDREIQILNNQYRHQDRPTDVLAFAALETELPTLNFAEDFADIDSEPVYLGDIVISVTTAKEQALERGHSINRELVWLAAHGLLHLLGWDHPDDNSLEEMLAEQELLIRAIHC
jgi:probable rRNA maturation factor